MRVLSAFVLATLLASTASAHPGYKIKMTAQYKETKKGDATFRNVFITGHAHYPDGTQLVIMIRPEKASYLPLTVRASVQKQEFAAEMGPWREGFPAGKYICEAWFELEKQSDGVKAALNETEEFAKCLLNNPEYQEQYKKDNPERYEKLMKIITATGKCSSNKQFGTCELTIGTADEAAQSDEADKAFIRDRADMMKDKLTDLMKTFAKHSDPNKGGDATAETYQTWSTEFGNEIGQVDQEISGKIRGTVYNEHKEAFGSLANAIMALQDLERNIQSSLYGDMGAKVAELQAIKDTPEGKLDKDQKRRREVLKRELSGIETERRDDERRFVDNMAQTLYGNRGLEPAPARLKKWVEEIKTEFDFQWND
ncbi:MAG: hypothetical protein K8T20_00910 [Planctomycetes bacterium]|nr:hypothetical protein [Planctomycetota bacterium]